MGIVLSKLGECVLNKSGHGQVEIEFNSGDIVHLQTSNLRFEFSRKEFMEIADVIIEAGKSLREKKKI